VQAKLLWKNKFVRCEKKIRDLIAEEKKGEFQHLPKKIDLIYFSKDAVAAITHTNKCSPLPAPLTRMGLYDFVKLRVKWQRYDLREKERLGGENQFEPATSGVTDQHQLSYSPFRC
jgi:hypothetical protein